jgi:quercetin dioxygenase-like cupin family protein
VAEFPLSYRPAHDPEKLALGLDPGVDTGSPKRSCAIEKEETTMDIHPCGSRPTRRGPADSFTGTVWQEPIVEAPSPARVRSGLVRFEPGARTAWHTHPLGQTLFVITGKGRVQTFGGPVREIRAGDVVWIPPHEKHWHGAAPDTTMEHVAMQEALDGKHVEWLEHVTDEQYKAPVG